LCTLVEIAQHIKNREDSRYSSDNEKQAHPFLVGSGMDRPWSRVVRFNGFGKHELSPFLRRGSRVDSWSPASAAVAWWSYEKNQTASSTIASIATISINVRRAKCDPASAITRTARAKNAPKTIADILDLAWRSRSVKVQRRMAAK